MNLIKSKKLSKFKNISHGFFGSKGGVSKGIYKSLNCGIGSSDNKINIEKNLNIPICLWDERLSTVGVFNLSSQLDINVSKREKKIDENAAAFILQGALDFLNN